MPDFRPLFIPVSAALLLAACATGSGIEVTRFHLNQPVPRASVAIVATDPVVAQSLEFRTYAAAIASEMARIGFETAVAPGSATYLAAVSITQQSHAVQRPSPFRIGFGLGGASFGGNNAVGGGVGVSAPVGKGRINETRFNTLSIKLKRRADESLIWEGTATDLTSGRDPKSSLSAAVPALAHAMLADFPGRSGVTAHYPQSR